MQDGESRDLVMMMNGATGRRKDYLLKDCVSMVEINVCTLGVLGQRQPADSDQRAILSIHSTHLR